MAATCMRKSQDRAQTGGLAAAGAARYSNLFSVIDRERESIERGPLLPAIGRKRDPQIVGDEQGLAEREPRLLGLSYLERVIDRQCQQAQKLTRPDAALMRLIDETVNLIQRRHHTEIQHRERQNITGPYLALDEQEDG